MIQCPICSQECPTMICTVCGYDSSTDYEQFSSLCEISPGIQSCSAVKKDRDRNIARLMLCDNCGGYFLSVAKDGKRLSCHKCGIFIPHPAWSSLEARVKLIEDELKLLRDSRTQSPETIAATEVGTELTQSSPFQTETIQAFGNRMPPNTDCVLSANEYCAILKYQEQSRIWIPSYYEEDIHIPENMIHVSAGYDHMIFLLEDGSASAVGSSHYGRCNVKDWTDLRAISAGWYHSVGLKSDGSVIAIGDNQLF